MSVDLVVIGSGPAGQKAALEAAKRGKSVLVVERQRIGGGCVHEGTLPSKSFRESVYRWSLGSRGSLNQDRFRKNPTMTDTRPRKPKRRSELPEMARLLHRRNWVVSQESEVIAEQFRRANIPFVQGRAQFQADGMVHVFDSVSGALMQEIRYERAMIATGARPVCNGSLHVDGVDVLDSNSILTLPAVPRTLAVLGAGIIGCEFASMFLVAGCQVSLIDRRPEILSSVDRTIVDQLMTFFRDKGMEFHLGVEAKEIRKSVGFTEDGIPLHEVELTNGSVLLVEKILIAQGRAGNHEGLGLASVGIQPNERGLIAVNPCYQTSNANIYATGDIIGFPALASTSSEQGRLAVQSMFAGGVCKPLSPIVPYGIYTIPEISTIGKTEAELVEQNVPYVVGQEFYREVARGQIVGDSWGVIKLLFSKTDGKLLGTHIIGDNAAEIIHIAQAVMVHGGTINYFIENVFNYPTMAEAYKAAASRALEKCADLAKLGIQY